MCWRAAVRVPAIWAGRSSPSMPTAEGIHGRRLERGA
jgi:hypothetical protein